MDVRYSRPKLHKPTKVAACALTPVVSWWGACRTPCISTEFRKLHVTTVSGERFWSNPRENEYNSTMSTSIYFAAATKRFLNITILSGQNGGTKVIHARKFSTGVRIKGWTTESLINSTNGFHFYPVAGVTFESWLKWYEDILQVDFSHHDDSSKVKVLFRKLRATEHEKYPNLILLRKLNSNVQCPWLFHFALQGRPLIVGTMMHRSSPVSVHLMNRNAQSLE